MIVNNSNLVLLGRQWNGSFRRGLNETPAIHKTLSTPVPSSTKQNDYGWLAAVEDVREWVGQREATSLSTFDYSLKNKHWEHTLEVDKDDIEDDNLGVYSMRAQFAGTRWATHPGRLIIAELMKLGHAKLCYDKQNFFDTDHPAVLNGAATTYQNYWSSGMPLNKTNALARRAYMLALTNEAGFYIASNPRLLIVPPQLEDEAYKIAEAQIVMETTTSPGNLAAGVTNTAAMKQRFDVLMIPELADEPTTWYLADVSQFLKPFLFQQRQKVQFQTRFNPNDDNVFWKRTYVWGSDARYNVGFTFWQLMAKCVG
jgi:phage major head subunit gpT-like protein